MDVAQADRTPIAQLPGPAAELMPAVAGRMGLHAIQESIATEHPRHQLRLHLGFGEAKLRCYFGRVRHEARLGSRGGRDAAEARTEHLPGAGCHDGVTRQLGHGAAEETWDRQPFVHALFLANAKAAVEEGLASSAPLCHGAGRCRNCPKWR
jgi:hypothetical protein